MKRLIPLLLAMVLLAGTAAADWTCGVCGFTWPDEAAYCDECGFDGPLRGLSVTETGTDSLLLGWQGGPRAVDVRVSPAGEEDWRTAAEQVTGGEYLLTGLAPDTAYDIRLDAGDGTVLTLTAATARAVSAALQPGSHVTFGQYPQSAQGTDSTPIEWLVLQVKDNTATLISCYGLDAQPYHTADELTNWKNCSLRKWLNENFLAAAFSPQEQGLIQLTLVDNSKRQGYPDWTYRKCSDTKDRVWLLSYAEAHKYFGIRLHDEADPENDSNILARVTPTAFALSRGAEQTGCRTETGEAAGSWWLRSYGEELGTFSFVGGNGAFRTAEDHTGRSICIRPVIRVTLTGGSL